MAAQNLTLRQVLTQQKPFVRCDTPDKKNTSSPAWPDLRNHVTIWADFTLENLNNSYGHVLDELFAQKVPTAQQVLTDVEAEEPERIKRLISWNDGLMEPTLEFTKSCLGLCPGVVLRHDYSTADKSRYAKIPNGPRRLTVDHVISLDILSLPNLVVGLAKPSSKWSGRKLANQLNNASMELLWPLRQLANICRVAQTRYGYIQTDEELVVCCFSMVAEQWQVAIMPIPWSQHGSNVLTTDLALWWLCMLAMSAPDHRAIANEEDMIRINEWDIVHLEEEQSWVRRHRYSNFQEPTSPPPVPAYRSPSPGNPAAFAAAVGLHMDDQFHIGHPSDASLVNPNTFNPSDLGFLWPDFLNDPSSANLGFPDQDNNAM